MLSFCFSSSSVIWRTAKPLHSFFGLIHNQTSIPSHYNLSTVTNGAGAAGALIMCFYSDIRGYRTEPVILSGISCILNLVLSIWNIPDGLKFFAYISVGWSYGMIPVLIAWTAQGLAGDLEVRALTLACYNCLVEITSLVVPLVAWPVSKAPGFRGGFIWVCLIAARYPCIL